MPQSAGSSHRSAKKKSGATRTRASSSRSLRLSRIDDLASAHFCASFRPFVMVILHDPRCAEYGSAERPEQPARVVRSAAHLRAAHPTWEWREPSSNEVTDDVLKLAHV